ncbi:MAG TPA: biotin synthase BioB [Planctomycetaceae bacterium]|jgi:biotin synthase|nr:biotin synthase BioB [Rhodopirellula sp.]HAL14414.1 biotin synthase BioB [Planctomycetaceae bacterium]HCK72867.1 biotin synthase BioB [Planctomycetaceae bacterium]HCP85060.1 biotin synthase BioB [Planctomycetaceae bacterium]|tara:strand:- start:984 stop:2018 length:1035 start_codon:yes stop_codon:yes gene_type:complete
MSTATPVESNAAQSSQDWQQLASRVLSEDHKVTRDEALAILRSSDDEILDLMSAAFRLRQKYFGKTVQLYFLMNAKSGLCPEDCTYCSQSKISDAEIPKYNILSRDKLLDGARLAAEQGAKTYCIVISARAPSEREISAVETIVPEIKQQYDLDICACLGLLDDDQAQRLRAAGVNRVNHNLNTSESHYSEICTTHTYQDRVETLQAVSRAGMEMCSGGIIGMGEADEDVVDMAISLRDLGVHSVPLNFLNPIDGTPLAGTDDLTPMYCLKALAMYRFVNPETELRIAGGREIHLGNLQSLALYAANSVFVGDYLTTQGQAPEEDYRMVEELGFEVTTNVERTE